LLDDPSYWRRRYVAVAIFRNADRLWGERLLQTLIGDPLFSPDDVLLNSCDIWPFMEHAHPHVCPNSVCGVTKFADLGRISARKFDIMMRLPTTDPNPLFVKAVKAGKLDFVRLICRHKLFDLSRDEQIVAMFEDDTEWHLPTAAIFDYVRRGVRVKMNPRQKGQLTQSDDPDLIRTVFGGDDEAAEYYNRVPSTKSLVCYSYAFAQICGSRAPRLEGIANIEGADPRVLWLLPLPPKKRWALLMQHAESRCAIPGMFAQLPPEIPEGARLALLRKAQRVGNAAVCAAIAVNMSLVRDEGPSRYIADVCVVCISEPPTYQYDCGCTNVCADCATGVPRCPTCR